MSITITKANSNGSATTETEGSINNIQQMWDATIGYYAQGMPDTSAMYKVYTRMVATLTYQDIANVFSGVYANKYWNINLMDYSILSKSLQSALAISPASLADTYAKNALVQWRGILTRKTTSDIGQIPVAGSVTASIDIVCNNSTELLPEQLIQNWNSVYWQYPQVGKNYVYTRCQNVNFFGDLSNSDSTPIMPIVHMYYTTGGFNQPPSSWLQLTTTDGVNLDGKVVLLSGVPGPMPQGTRGCSESFFFNPTSTDHVCLIATVTTDYFSNPKNADSNWNSSTWITHNGAGAWKNVNPQQGVENTLSFYNQDDSNEKFVFKVQCQNVPEGSKISLKSADKSIALDSGTLFVNKHSANYEFAVDLPANYKGELIVSMEDATGNMLPANASVHIDMYWRLPKGHKQYEASIALYNAHEKSNTSEDHDLIVGSYTLTGNDG
ncbi:hypothetical protein [Aquimarina sp. RZ0]|uniref:hypothetical protein n=1 Tax=Aquimarina sp. RZ0 TaxID=2607730 RepID=UPI0011F3FFC0|nr:hypothetical protein [Aquimarina sp. RZ0]KAA1245562.1 hypothetical protein F0000_11465 [Aquimarina sp. RZ0]